MSGRYSECVTHILEYDTLHFDVCILWPVMNYIFIFIIFIAMSQFLPDIIINLMTLLSPSIENSQFKVSKYLWLFIMECVSEKDKPGKGKQIVIAWSYYDMNTWINVWS